jgi:hypothetical protein
MDSFDRMFEQFRVSGKELGAKVRELIHQGNVRRIIVRDDGGHTFMEIPLTVAAIGVVAAPVLAAVGAIATLVSNFEIVVERVPVADSKGPRQSRAASASNVGATEEKVNMAATVPEHVDKKGTKLEDIAGTGQHDSLGG